MKPTLKILLSFFFLFCITTLVAENNYEKTISPIDKTTTTGTLSILTNVEKVEVYINNVYYGHSPVTVEELTPGMYFIKLLKDGYEEKSAFVEVKAGTISKLFFELKPLLGFLRITSNVNNATIFINGSLFDNVYQFIEEDSFATVNSGDTGIIQIPEGSYSIEVQKFGYETVEYSVVVVKDKISNLGITMKKSSLSIQSFYSSPKSFNPNSPELLGSTSFQLNVNAPCTASIEIFNENKNIIYRSLPKKMNSETNTFSWDGKNDYGFIMNDGIYTANVKVIPDTGWNIRSATDNDSELYATTTATIDSSIFYPLVGANAGGSSTGIPTPRLMPKGTMLFTITGMADFSFYSGYKALPFAFDFVFNPFTNTELSFRFGFEPQYNGNLPVFFGGSIKYAAPLYPFYLGGLLRYTYATEPSIVSVFSEPGLGIGIIAGVELQDYLLSFSEEVVFGSEKGNIINFDGHLKTGFSMQFQRSNFSTNTWIALYSPFTFKGMDFFGQVETGLDFSYLIPNTSISPTIGFNYVYSKLYSHSMAIHFGFNMLLL